MMIPRERLSGEDVRQIVEQTIRAYLNVAIVGYKCDSRCVVNVLVKAAVEGQTIESACEDLELEVSSNTVREHLNALLDVYDLRRHECEMNAGLVSCIPEQLPRRGCEMALDFHDEPFYGKTLELRSYACRGEGKEGTTYFYRVATLYVRWRAVRVTLAMTYVLPEDSNLSVVQRLLQRMQHLAFRPGVVYMDKEFCEGPIVRYLKEARIPAIVACTIRGSSGGTRALCRGRKAYCTDYTFSDGTNVRLALMPAHVPDKSGRRRVKWLAFVVIHLDWAAKKVAQRYRRRFGIETTYRQLNPLRARTTSRNPALRFFLLGLGFLLLNIWVMLRWLATRLIAHGPARWDEDLFRLFRFITFLRRAIEHLLGTTNSIPIYSW
jgi:Transposase DDE domain